MTSLFDSITNFDQTFMSFGWVTNVVTVLRTIIILVLMFLAVYIVITLLLNLIKKVLLRKAKSKKHVSNIGIFSSAVKYVILFIFALFLLTYYTGSLTGFGLGIGFLSGALAFGLQRPIMSVAGWFMILTKRPFEIGDRVVIGNVKGDVEDITLTHIYLKELGGLVQSEDISGRHVLVPNSVLFEQNVINYTIDNDYLLDQVVFTVTYESNLDKALNIGLEAAKKLTKEATFELKKQPYVRLSFQSSGIDVQVRFYSTARTVHETSSKITREIYDKISEAKDIDFAYPHTEVILKKEH